MGHYVKTFDRIFRSTIWQEDSDTRIVWWTMLLLADRDGSVYSTLPGLSHTARVPMDVCKSAITKFLGPDEYSDSEVLNGRRIQKIDGGWSLVNFFKYREMMDADDQAEKTRLRVQAWRQRQADKKVRETSGNVTLRSVTPVTFGNDIVKEEGKGKEEDQDQKRSARKARTAHFSIPSLGEVTAYCQERHNSVDPQQWFNHYTANGWRVGRNAMKDWRAAIRTWENNEHGTGRQAYKQPKAAERPDLAAQSDPDCRACYGGGYAHREGQLVPCACIRRTLAGRSDRRPGGSAALGDAGSAQAGLAEPQENTRGELGRTTDSKGKAAVV